MPPEPHRILTATAGPDDAGQRLDRFLAGRWPELSRARLQALLAAGAVERDGVLIAEGSARVKPGQSFVLRVPEATPARPQPEDLALDVLYEDEHLLVLEKPAGMVVHPAPGHAARHAGQRAAGALPGDAVRHRRRAAAGHRAPPRQGGERADGGRQGRSRPCRARRPVQRAPDRARLRCDRLGRARARRRRASRGRSAAIRAIASAWRWSRAASRR